MRTQTTTTRRRAPDSTYADPPLCDVCHRYPANVLCDSKLLELNYRYCGECLLHNAEPVTAFIITFRANGGKVRPWVESLCTYVDGRYVPWMEWVTQYARK